MTASPLVIVALLIAPPLLVAQDDSALPGASATDASPSERLPGVAPTPGTAPVPPGAPQLFPGEITPPPDESNRREQLTGTLPGPAATHAPKVGRTEKSEEDVLARIRFQRAKVAAKTDPGVREALAYAAAALTDYDRRSALKHYYQRLYDRMAKLDSRFPELLAKARALSLVTLVQTKVRPTVEPVRLGSVTR